MTFPRYPDYKNSGVEWLGEVPEHWSVERIRRFVKLNPSKSELGVLDKTTEVSFLPMEAIGDEGSLSLEKTKPLSEVETGYTYFREGDVTVAKITPCFENGKGAVMKGLHNGFGFGTTELIVARPTEGKVIANFLHQLFSSSYFRKNAEGSMYGAGGQKRVPDDFIREFQTGLPPINEQVVIAKFLENETAKIAILVAEQEKLIELLKEKRRVFITNAVTKGLDRTVEMKESGIEWIGLIPKHWTVRKLKFLADIRTGDKDTEDSVEDGDYPFFVRSQTIERINSHTYDCEAILTAGDGAGVGKVFHYFNGPFDFHQRVYMLNNFKEVAGKYLFHFFKENFFKVALEGGAKSTVDSLRRPMLTNFSISFPDIEEQKNIVTVIEEKAVEFDQLILEASNAIQLLQERRSVLISAAVTGQIDVRNYQPKEIA